MPSSPANDPAGDPSGEDAASAATSGLGELPELPAGVVIPDDPAALDADREAFVRELRQRTNGPSNPAPHLRAGHFDGPADQSPEPWPLGAARLRHSGISGPLAFLMLTVVALTASAMIVLMPRPSLPAQTLAVGTPAPGAVDGQVGGLLPASTAQISGLPRSLRAVRPAVIAVLADGACDGTCTAALSAVNSQARQYAIPLWIAGPASAQRELVTITRATTGGRPPIIDNTGALASSLAPTPGIPTLVFVHADGIIHSVVRGVSPQDGLEPSISALQDPGGPTP
jgi:hypothetical protein